MNLSRQVLMMMVLLPTVAYSAGQGVYSVTRVGCATTNGQCWLTLSPPVSTSINNCASGYEARFSLSDPGSKGVLSLALSAYTTGKRLEIYIQDGASCLGSYPSAVYVSIVP